MELELERRLRGWGETSTDLPHRLDYSPSDDGALAGREGN